MNVPVSPSLCVSQRIYLTENVLPHQKRKGIGVTHKAGTSLGKNIPECPKRRTGLKRKGSLLCQRKNEWANRQERLHREGAVCVFSVIHF